MSIRKTDEPTNQIREPNSKTQILKSTAIFGSAQVIIILVGIFRTKVLAVLLGPVGVGISGLYQSTIDLIKAGTGLGLGYAGVRDIAAASVSGDRKKISTVIVVVKRWAWATGLLGLVITVVFSRQLSRLAFGDDTHAVSISILSICLLLSALAGFRSALLQGFRRIPQMAKSTTWVAIGSLAGTSLIYYFWGIDGIIPAIILIGALELIVTWFYSRNIKAGPGPISIRKSFTEGKAMVQLGFFMTISVLANTGSMYFVRTFIVNQNGLATVGYFIAAWTISSLYISAIFNAMGADYFPRLSSVQHDASTMKKMVNDQTETALLLTAPLIIAMISFIDLLVPLFYTRAFTTTASILSWQLAGDFFKILSWPLGFILLAKGKGLIFLVTELLWNLIFCSSVYFAWEFLGIEVTGIGFLVAYIFYLLVVWVVVIRLIGFQWTASVWRIICFFLPLLCLSFLAARYWQGGARFIAGFLLTISAAGFSYVHLRKLIDFKGIVNRFRSRMFSNLKK